ncbi:hypothetical protein CJU90_1311 [Yarrowia sp. C11]|nr:hypothetical protein CJU90_1311 [Yarrowia sp. C11]
MSISAQDLLEYHEKRLGQFKGTIKFDDDSPEEDTEPSLGFYPDGVERTLTDEQIEFFHQSEIRKEELRIYKENLALQGAKETQAEEVVEIEAEVEAEDPTSQHAQTQVANDEEQVN